MDLFAVILLLILYFVRLHDWVPFLSGMNVIKPAMLLGAFGLMTRESRTPAWKFMSTPHEWVMVVYLFTCVWQDPDWFGTVPEIVPLASFYFLTAHALNTKEKLEKFFGWWCFCIVFMAAVGALTLVGIDITNASQLIVENMGRLGLNTYIMDNPNALGHTMVTGLSLVYMMMVFRRDVGLRFLAVPLFILVIVCVVATESKGSYISGTIGFASVLLIGRKLWAQIGVGLGLAVMVFCVSTMLPRMVNRDALRQDEGVMGRLMAFESARTAYNTAPTGWRKFQATIKWQGQDEIKSTHSSYVQIGADLGPTGLFLYLSTLCCACRSLFRYRVESDSLERSRRLLFALIVGFAVSGWMIVRPYHVEYFLMMGAATAYHRLAIEKLKGVVPEFGALSVMEQPIPARDESKVADPAAGENAVVTEEDEQPPKRKFWNRYGILDFGMAYVALQSTVWLWDYIIQSL